MQWRTASSCIKLWYITRHQVAVLGRSNIRTTASSPRADDEFSTWRIPSSAMWRHVTRAITDVSEERIAPIIRVKRISTLGTELAIVRIAVSSWRIPSPWWWRRYYPPKLRFLQEPYGVISKKTAVFIVTAVKASNLTIFNLIEKFLFRNRSVEHSGSAFHRDHFPRPVQSTSWNRL
jgi:hypothetical protein